MADPSTAAAAAVPAGQPPPPQLPQCTTTAETETPPAAPSAVPATLGRVVKLETLVPRYAALPAGTATSPRPFARHPSPRPTVESRFLHEHAEGVAPFIIKLFDLVSDPESAHLVCPALPLPPFFPPASCLATHHGTHTDHVERRVQPPGVCRVGPGRVLVRHPAQPLQALQLLLLCAPAQHLRLPQARVKRRVRVPAGKLPC